MPDYTIEPTRPEPEELDTLAAIYAEAFALAPWGERHSPKDVRRMFERILNYEDSVFLTAFDADSIPVGALVAFGMEHKPRLADRLLEPFREGLFLDELFLAPAWRRRGVGTELIQSFVRMTHVRRGTFSVVASTSAHAKDALAFLRRFSFLETFEEPYAVRHALPSAQLPARRVVLTALL